MEPTVQSTESAWMLQELRDLFPGCPMWTAAGVTELDLRVLLDLYRPRRASIETRKPTGIHTQIGGNRVYLTPTGIAVRAPAGQR